MSQQIQVWDLAKARAAAAEKNEAVSLSRTDGTNSGWVMLPNGQLRRAGGKPQGKAARKQFKALRRQVRALDPEKNGSAIRILTARARNLCKP